MTCSELATGFKERFWAPVRSKSLRFLHRLTSGAIVPSTITTTANAIRSQNDPPLAGTAGAAATGPGVLVFSTDVLSDTAAVLAAGVLTGSEGSVTLTSGVVVGAAAAWGAFRRRADDRAG